MFFMHIIVLLFISPMMALDLFPHPYRSLHRRPVHRPQALLQTNNPSSSSTSTSSSSFSSSPYCTPDKSCWPDVASWTALNVSINGALIAVSPPLASCFGFDGKSPDSVECSSVESNYSNSYFRASLPGASQEVNWEQDADTSAACFSAPCSLGNIPPFAVRATRVSDVQKALSFAISHNIRIVIKSSGHEYQGRSTGRDALLIWMHAFKGISYNPSFSSCSSQEPVQALTSAPGDSWGEVYAVADSNHVEVVGGSEISVSSCGGYTLGGGHSWMGPAHGMAVDNVLSFSLILANGTFVTASACENKDLFWALRGGGGGTFGVLTSCTYRAHQFSSTGAAGAFITIELLRSNSSFNLLMNGWLSFVEQLGSPDLSGGVVVGGYYLPVLDAPEGTHEHVSFLLGVNGTVAQANTAFAPIAAWVESHPSDLSIIGADIVPFVSLMAFHEYYDSNSESTGYAGTIGSRLLPAAALKDPIMRASIAEVLTTITYSVGLTGQLVCGGAVASADPKATSLSPVWRTTGSHVSFGRSWEPLASAEERAAVFAQVSQLTDLLRNATGTSGAYWSESDFFEPQWEDAFWGSNYPRLQAIKATVDPNGVFTCHHCVVAS